jgi:transglutaminase-like putative cysteine protease
MLFEIEHLTRYRYSLPVQLAEHVLRFLPLARPGQRLVDYRLHIEPQPEQRAMSSDGWGNPVERVRFGGTTTELAIALQLVVETVDMPTSMPRRPVPLDYGVEAPGLGPYLAPLADAGVLLPVLSELPDPGTSDVLTLLTALNHAVHGLYHHGVRIDGAPRTPAETLARGEGVCRDLTVLFMAAARQLGIAARFVSGYQQGDGVRARRYLHAWPEVYLPGSGWVGFDPTHDCLAGADHVAISGGPTAEAVAPVEGGYTFQGAVLDTTLDTDIRITTR